MGITGKMRSHTGNKVHHAIRNIDGIIGMITVIPFSTLKLSSPEEASDKPCVIPKRMNAEAATCSPLSPVYLAAITEAIIAEASAIW